MSFSKDIDVLNNVYTYRINESAQNQKTLPPEIIKGITALAEKAVDGDEDAIKMFSDPKYAEQILVKAQQEASNKQEGEEELPVTEAFEKLRAKIGSKLTGSDSVQNRYNLFLRDVNGHLWEIDKDSRLLNVEPKEVNKFMKDIIDIEPGVDKQGKLLQKIGYGIGQAVGTAMFAGPFVIATTYLGPAMGLYGISAKLLAGALTAGGRTVSFLNNNQLSRGEKVSEIVKAAIAGFSLMPDVPAPGGYKAFSGPGEGPINPSDAGATTQATTAAVPDPSSEIIKDWPRLSKTVFGRMGLTGDALRSVSVADETALQQIIATLKQQGLDWSQMSMQDKAKIFNPIAKSVLSKYR